MAKTDGPNGAWDDEVSFAGMLDELDAEVGGDQATQKGIGLSAKGAALPIEPDEGRSVFPRTFSPAFEAARRREFGLALSQAEAGQVVDAALPPTFEEALPELWPQANADIFGCDLEGRLLPGVPPMKPVLVFEIPEGEPFSPVTLSAPLHFSLDDDPAEHTLLRAGLERDGYRILLAEKTVEGWKVDGELRSEGTGRVLDAIMMKEAEALIMKRARVLYEEKYPPKS